MAAGSAASNAAVLASSPLLSGLLSRTYAENEMIPAGLRPSMQKEASTLLALDPGMEGRADDMLAWANAPATPSAIQAQDMKSLLLRR